MISSDDDTSEADSDSLIFSSECLISSFSSSTSLSFGFSSSVVVITTSFCSGII